MVLGFLIAFFGSIYYLLVILGGKASSASNRVVRSYEGSCFKKIKADFETSFQVGESIWKDKDAKFENIIATIEPDFSYALGENWREEYKELIEHRMWSRDSFQYGLIDRRGDPMWVAQQIILAHQGKIEMNESVHKICGSPEMQQVQLRTFEIIKREIQKKYPDYNIVITQRNPNSVTDGGWIKWNFGY